jgi:protease I
MMDDLANAGATVIDEPVVVDGNVVTNRFIFDIPQFVEAIVTKLKWPAAEGKRRHMKLSRH